MDLKGKIFYLNILILIFVFSVNTVYSAPYGLGIAINKETKECTGYGPGDEFTRNILPEGWKFYSPDYDKGIFRGNCIKGTNDCPDEFQCIIDKINLIIPRCYQYEGQCQGACEGIGIIETEIGNCYYQLYQDEFCCNQLGYTYVSKDIAKTRLISLGYGRLLFSPLGLTITILFLIILFFVIKYLFKKRKS